MPLFSDHISNMYYSGSSLYTSSPYNSAVSPYGSSYSASYLNPGGNYSSHSSFGGYSRAPISTRWVTSGGRTYSPMLSSISEKGTSSPVRINSPRRIPISTRSYVPSPYTSRPININTADIDVSRDKYRNKIHSSNSTLPTGLPPRRQSPLINKENGHDKPDTGIDTSPGPRRSTIKRDRTVVRLHTVKRKERDSPRKPAEVLNNATNNNSSNTDYVEKQSESKKWREKFAEDLAYTTQKEKKTLGAKLVEKFTLKEKVEGDFQNSAKTSPKNHIDTEKSPEKQNNDDIMPVTSKSFDRRCSMELLAEQASLLDSLIRRENLSTAPLDISKVGALNVVTSAEKLEPEDKKKRKLAHQKNLLSTTKSDHSLHDSLASKDNKDPLFPKRKSLRKCSSGSNIRKLDCIKEIPKKTEALNVPPLENELLIESKILKPKIKTKITSTVEVTSTTPQLKFVVENVTVEEKCRPCKKDIIFSSTVDEIKPLNNMSTEDKTRKSVKLKNQIKPQVDIKVDSDKQNIDFKVRDKKPSNENVQATKGHRKSIKSKPKEKSKPKLETSGNLTSPEPEDGNFWEKIGKRETVYLINRKQNLEEAKEQTKRTLFWFPEDEETPNVDTEEIKNLDEKVLEETIDANLGCTTKETNKNFEKAFPEVINSNLNDLQKIETVHSDVNSEELLNTPIMKAINEDSIIKNTVNISGVEKGLPFLDLTTAGNAISNLKSCRTSETDMDGKKEKQNLIKVKDVNKNYQEIERTGEIAQPQIILNKINIKEEDTTNINKSKYNKNNNVDEPKSLNEKNSVRDQNIYLMQTSISSNLKEEPEANCNRNSLSNNIQISPIESSIISEKLLAGNNDIKNSHKDEIENISTIKISTGTIPNASVNAAETFNIPGAKIMKSSTNISPKMKNTDSPFKSEIEIKADKQDEASTLLHSCKDVAVNIENTTTEINKDFKIEPEIINANIEKTDLTDNRDNNTQLEENNPNIEVEDVSKNVEFDKEIEETITKSEPVKTEPVPPTDAFQVFTNMKPVKEEKALKPLIATPRPLRKRNPQSIRSSSSSSSETSDDESSEEDTKEDANKDEGESGSSQGECENNPDGRISTGSNDSGFDSSAPTSPSGFLHAKKEHSTAYDLFRKTGRFTPPARTIPRFRKYTIEDFQFIRVLGKGSFGKVMLAELRDTEYYYAVKCLKKDVVLEDDDVECTLIERKVLALGTNHPYLCHLFATFQTDSHLFFVMEYLNGGDLMFHIQQSGRFPEVKARFYAAEIVSGLKFLHKRGIVYRDLKLDNILLDFDGHVRIADFGMCKLQIYLDKTADTFCGTPDYMAPEIIKGIKYNQTVDWWSFGVLLYEMLIGQSPFSGCDEDELFWSICNEMPSYPRFLSPESLSILTRLLDKDARTRLGGPECMHGDIRDQKFFEQIHWDRLERRELEAPFKPRVRHPMDTQYFDRAFTGERPRLTAVEPQVLRSMDQEPFRGFSYTNPNATDR
ncbi:probable serine/threonine-protein kinase drkD isoform X3 [Pararge aegeria]|uniref:probable serine/threonine-protein kinase drkD isoform X3 n=1 Tax=Pararge aegeria TaxID=116150 RepID=UPI0019D30C77|nr:probable serine/threonine-protein kinase drkD isoform X3 [Pararge aegeria]